MTPTTTERDPDPTAASAPCRECGTTGGLKRRDCHRPNRTQGYCRTCYNRLLAQGRLDVGHGSCLGCATPAAGGKRGLCTNCYNRARRQGTIRRYPLCGAIPVPHLDLHEAAHPAPLPAVVTPAMLGIRPGEIGKHYFIAQAQLWADEAACILAGAQWRQRHPEQFAPDHLARIFGGDATHAFWREDAAAAA